MFRRRFFFGFLGMVLLLGLLAFGGYALLQTGVNQGYALGLQAAGAETAPGLVPPAGPLPYRYAPFWGFGFGIGKVLLTLFFFLILARIFFLPWIFRRSRWPYCGPHPGYHPGWGPPPWAREQEGEQPQEGDVPDEDRS